MNEKKNDVKKKKKKKRSGNWIGYCPTRSRYNQLYRNIAVMGVQFGWGACHDTIGCIVTGGGLTSWWIVSRYTVLYRDKDEGLAAGGLCRDTVFVS